MLIRKVTGGRLFASPLRVPLMLIRKVTGGRLFASPLRVPLSLIRKRYRRTSFCVTLKGATLSYPQEVPEDVFLRHP